MSTQISMTVIEEKEQQSFFGLQGSRLTGDLRFSFNTKKMKFVHFSAVLPWLMGMDGD